MGRPRSFDEDDVLSRAGELFQRLGYEATSVDDLVTGLGLHRGSLYKAFGSKRGLFVLALRRLVAERLPAAISPDLARRGDLDLVLVAALELAARDAEVRDLVDQACALLDDHPDTRARGAAHVLGERLLARARPVPTT